MYYRLQEDSVRVVNGELYTAEGKLLYDPAILVMGDILLKAGNYEDMDMALISLQKDLISRGLESNNIYLISLNDNFSENFTVNDVCYIIRRSVEFTGKGFVEKLIKNRESVDFLEWFNSEKEAFPLQTDEEYN